jgi:hypothetical protein
MDNCRRVILIEAKESQLVQKFASLRVFKSIRKFVKKGLLASSRLSVLLSARMEQLDSHWTDFQVF